MAFDPELKAHQDWLGYVQPVGLVVSGPALIAAQAILNRNPLREQPQLAGLVGPEHRLDDVPRFFTELLGWRANDLAAPSDELSVVLPEYGETLRPTYFVPDPDAPAPLMLVQVLAAGTDLDATPHDDAPGWAASPQTRFERLLRETNVPVGLIFNGASMRLVYAPRGETSGHATFVFEQMCRTDGRIILAAVLLLLHADRVFTTVQEQKLLTLLRESRRYQNDVSTKLAEQVLQALQELLRGFQAADAVTKGQLLGELKREAPEEIYGGLLATILRLVFVLYAEDRGLMPADPVYQQHYALGALFKRLREDASRYPDTMDQRYGAWSQLLTLFRFIVDGASHGGLHMPARHGRLFEPDAYPFLEGRQRGSNRQVGAKLDPPKVSDGVVLRVLENLLLLGGERISYRALDVEQIGSVYESMMGFELKTADGKSVAVKPNNVVVDLDALLEKAGKDRAKALEEDADCKLAANAQKALAAAKNVDELVEALGNRLSKLTPSPLPKESMFLQPGQERRRSGSHYTPRSLTEPIVRKTLTPVLEALGPNPTPEQILELKVCDPAMGSGAFLVEACRFLGDALKEAWSRHKSTPQIPPDEDLVLHARRLVAQRCLYGVDKNPFAVNLAKLSLWLVTLAREHPFTFLDHALRCGDSLVGLTREQIACFHWAPSKQLPTIRTALDSALKVAEEKRRAIHALGDSEDTTEKERLLRDAEDAIAKVRQAGDAVIGTFFSEEKAKAREAARAKLEDGITRWLASNVEQRAFPRLRDEHAQTMFHWELEFPEVFARENPGFDAFVGNPPFLGGTIISGTHGAQYLDWLNETFRGAGNRADLVTYFFRRTFGSLRIGGAVGLLATNTIAQGDTRTGGLARIVSEGGTIFDATRTMMWPGTAAVAVSVVHIIKGRQTDSFHLDGVRVSVINSRLRSKPERRDPSVLSSNANQSFLGFKAYGQGFVLTPAERQELIDRDRRNAERIFPYLGGEEVNTSPTQSFDRYVINFGEMPLEDAERWSDLISIVREKVKPERDKNNRDTLRKNWWQFGEKQPALARELKGKARCLVTARVTKHLCFSFQPADRVLSEQLLVFPFEEYARFSVMQSRVHEAWARLLSSSMRDDLRYSPSDCFENFPFPPTPALAPDGALERIGAELYDFRAKLMVARNQGLTTTYNQLKDPDEHDPEIEKLRELHLELDRAVWAAYGWPNVTVPPYTTPRTEAEKAALEAFEDEIIDRLFALNAERAEQEKMLGDATPAPAGKQGRKPRKPKDDKTGKLL